MTNAMVFNEEYEASGSDVTRYASVFGMGEAVPDAPGSLCELLLGLQRDPSRADGAVFTYQTATTEMINWALNRATGRGFAGFVQDDLWSRLGTEGETFVIVDPKGAPMAGGGLNATAPDIARFAAMMLDGGQFDGHQIVPQQVIDTVRAGASTKAFEAGGEAVGTMTDPQWSYRAQWWIRRSPGREAIMAIGIHGQWIYIDHDRQVAVIQQASQPEASTVYFSDYTFHAIDAVVDYLAGKGG